MNRKTIILIVILVVLTALGLWVKSRWNAWFVMAPEKGEFYTSVADRITLLPGDDFSDERIITWRCDTVPQNMWVDLQCGDKTGRVEAKAGVVESRGVKSVYYRAELNDLIPDSLYSYRIVSDMDTSRLMSFKMSASIRKMIFIGDVQDTVGGLSRRIIPAIDSLHRDADAWAFVGDLIEGPAETFWHEVYVQISDIATRVPIIAAAGNHEYIKSVIPYIDPRWFSVFSYDRNGSGAAPGSYYVESDDMLIVVLDSHCFQWGYPLLAQRMWLDDVLGSKGEGKWKIVMMHHPLHSVRRGKDNAFARYLFAPVMSRHRVHLVLQGHEHGYMRCRPDEKSPVYILSHCSPKNYDSMPGDSSKTVIAGKRLYQTLDFASGSLTVRSYDAITHCQLDSVTINK